MLHAAVVLLHARTVGEGKYHKLAILEEVNATNPFTWTFGSKLQPHDDA